jgi:phosphoribosylaminoimidazolecarboxamide formyltransferase / IMP cyclohydrolase
VAQRRALISVSDKRGLQTFGPGLVDLGFEVVSTGGTAKALRQAKVPVTEVADVTGFPEILDGRVKTLHPKILGGVLAVRSKKDHVATLAEHAIAPVDVVAVNLYPFIEETGRKPLKVDEAMELVDIGGPSLLRSAAKNHGDVLPVVDPDDYEAVLQELRKPKVDDRFRVTLASKAFSHTARYDAFIAHYFQSQVIQEKFPWDLVIPFHRREVLRYGENHHQEAAFYDDPFGLFGREPGAATFRQLHGKPLSYNNLLDADAVVEAIKEFDEPTVVIVKHVTPSGIASAKSPEQAWADAYATDTYSPFGGVVAANRPVGPKLAQELTKVFLELIVAPAFEPKAIEVLRAKKNLRLLEVPRLGEAKAKEGFTLTSITGGMLLQDRDMKPFDLSTWRTVTKKKPTKDQFKTMLFAARCVKHVKSNAVVFAKGTRTVGIGGGQTARVDATWIACHKGKENIRGSVMASEAFFPFRDAVDVAAENGVVAIVQPGGSIRDDEVIAAADEKGLAMVLSGHRSFRH